MASAFEGPGEGIVVSMNEEAQSCRNGVIERKNFEPKTQIWNALKACDIFRNKEPTRKCGGIFEL